MTGSGTTTVTAHVPAGMPASQYQFWVAGTGPGAQHLVPLAFTTQQGADFTLNVSAMQTIQQSQSATYTIALSPAGGFNGAVTLSMGAITGGVTAGLSSTTITASSPATLTLTASSTATLGTYRILVNGGTATASHPAVAPLFVKLGNPAPGATITLGRISVQRNGTPSTIVSPFGSIDSLTACSSSTGVTATVVQAPGSVYAQALRLTPSQAAQTGAGNYFTCSTSSGRTLTDPLDPVSR